MTRAGRRVRVLASLLLVATPAGAKGMAAETAFRSLWNALPQRSGWQMQVSPPFPAAWPQPAPGAVLRYAFAIRLDPTVADGVAVAAPWAVSTQGAAGPVTVRRLSGHLRPLGIQGVRPLDGAEIAAVAREGDAARRLSGGGAAATSGVVRDVTCGWIARMGVVAAAIAPRHRGFLRWLACR